MPSYQRYDGIAQDYNGNVLAGASIAVTRTSDAGTPTIYSDEILTAKTNPLTSGADGSFWFYGMDDDYTLVATHGGNTFTLGDVTLSQEHAEYKTAATSRNNAGTGTTMMIDPDLVTSRLTIGGIYYFKMCLYVTATTNCDFKFGVYGAAPGGTERYAYQSVDGDGVTILATSLAPYNNSVSVVYVANPTLKPVTLDGWFVITDERTIALWWAQDTAHVDFTTLGVGSFFYWRKVS